MSSGDGHTGRVDVNLEGALLDVLVVEGDSNLVVSFLERSISNVVGSVVVIDGVGVDKSRWSLNHDREGMASARNGTASSVDGLNREVGFNAGLVTREETWTLGDTFSGNRSALEKLLLGTTSSEIQVITEIGDVTGRG